MIIANTDVHDYEKAALFLSSIDADWARHIAHIGPCTHETKPAREPYEALIRAIAFQQLHAKAGNAILGRMLALFPDVPFPTPDALVHADVDALRSCGFSANKIITIQGVAQGALSGIVPSLQEALTMDDDALIKRLVTLRGIGQWTVEMLLIYTLSRLDVLPVDDLGVRQGYRRLKRLDQAPTRREMQTFGTAWQPYRTIATWYLWRLPA